MLSWIDVVVDVIVFLLGTAAIIVLISTVRSMLTGSKTKENEDFSGMEKEEKPYRMKVVSVIISAVSLIPFVVYLINRFG